MRREVRGGWRLLELRGRGDHGPPRKVPGDPEGRPADRFKLWVRKGDLFFFGGGRQIPGYLQNVRKLQQVSMVSTKFEGIS